MLTGEKCGRGYEGRLLKVFAGLRGIREGVPTEASGKKRGVIMRTLTLRERHGKSGRRPDGKEGDLAPFPGKNGRKEGITFL